MAFSAVIQRIRGSGDMHIAPGRYKAIAERIDRDRGGYPVMWVPMRTGGETEGASIEGFMKTFGIPYQVTPITGRDRHAKKVTSPNRYQMRERAYRLLRDEKADKIFLVGFDDLLSTGLDMAIVLDELYALKADGVPVHEIKAAAIVDNIGGVADPGYAVVSADPHVFSDKHEMMTLFRELDADAFMREVERRRGLVLPEHERTVHASLANQEDDIEHMLRVLAGDKE